MPSLGPSLPLTFRLLLSPACSVLQRANLLWYSLSPLFYEGARQCLRLELFMGKFSLFLFFLSLAIPQFGLLSHVSSLRLSSGHSGPVLTLSNAACTSPISPRLLVVDTSIWATSPLGVAVRHGIFGFYLFISSWLCCPLRFRNSQQTHRWEGLLVFGNFSFTTPSSGQVSIPNSFVSLFIFYILSYLLSKTMGCLSGCLVASAIIQKLFLGICSVFKWSFDDFVGEKVVSPSYSSTIFHVFWTWVWASSGSFWWTGKPDVLWPRGHKELDMTEQLNWSIQSRSTDFKWQSDQMILTDIYERVHLKAAK